MNDNQQPSDAASVQCRPTKDPAIRWFIFAAMMVGFSVWCYSDQRPAPAEWNMKHINEIGAYLLNDWGPAVLIPAGLFAVAMGIRHLTRTLVADDEGIGFGAGRLSWDQITAIDVSKLKDKGILRINHGDRQLKLADWKHHNFRDMVAFLERKLPNVQRISASEQSAAKDG